MMQLFLSLRLVLHGFFNLIAAFFATYIIKNFEGTIEKLAILAALMLIIASVGGALELNHLPQRLEQFL